MHADFALPTRVVEIRAERPSVDFGIDFFANAGRNRVAEPRKSKRKFARDFRAHEIDVRLTLERGEIRVVSGKILAFHRAVRFHVFDDFGDETPLVLKALAKVEPAEIRVSGD